MTSRSSAPPEPIRRTKLDRWLRDRDITNAVAGQRLGCSGESVRRYRLPFGDSSRRIPDEKVLTEIHAWTAGEITPADFYPPALTGADPSASMDGRQ